MRTSIVLGLLFGDEGKGLTTSCLSKENDLVVRFNGGHQAGHTVEKRGYRHIFSSFGSGTLNNAHTYWSEFCTFYPKAFANELSELMKNGIKPSFFINPLSMVTTPFDVEANRKTENKNQYGSVGVGFGTTIKRHTETPFKLFVQDILYKPLFEHKLEQIRNYYKSDLNIDEFISCSYSLDLTVCGLSEIKNNYNNIVFEGAQGIMLDMDFGFFPNVTRSNTTSKNAMQIIENHSLPLPEVFYVIRSYLTRHGNGFMPNESNSICFNDKTNIYHTYQGEFRKGFHSLELINYALKSDGIFSNGCNKNLVVTCLNQSNGLLLIDNDFKPVGDFIQSIEIDNFYESYNPTEIRLSKTKAENPYQAMTNQQNAIQV